MAGSLEQLTEAVLQAPDDDAPRLSLAAALAAKGDPRGEFIHAQVELARPAPDDERDRLARRARELLVRHEAEWVGPVADAVTAWRFHRGFIDDVTLDAEVLLANAETLFKTAPIRSLRVHEAGGLGADLAACPQLARISHLHIGSDDGDSEPLGDIGVAALARSPHLDRLQGFGFGMEQIEDSGLSALAGAPWLRGLRRLDLSRNELRDDALAVFFAAAPLQQLEHLNLNSCDAGITRSRGAGGVRHL